MLHSSSAPLRVLIVLTLVVRVPAVGPARAIRADEPHLIVLGDSLSDPGNLFALLGVPPFPYFEGRFSNGPVWAEHLAEGLSLAPQDVVNLAVGGAATGSENFRVPPVGGMLDQLESLIDSGAALGPDTWIVVWGGANDIFIALGDPATAPARVAQAVENMYGLVDALAALGGQRFLVPDLPDLGRIPDSLAFGPEVSAGVTALSTAFNEGLRGAMSLLEESWGGAIEIRRLRVEALFDDILDRPESYGFENVTDRCLAADFSSVCKEPSTFLFWDGAHPVARGHEVIADAALELVLPRFVRGDCNGDGRAAESVDDALALLGYLFRRRGGVPCRAACDYDADGRLRLDDAMRLLALAFVPGVKPPEAPYPACGTGRSEADRGLGCAVEPEACRL